MTIKNLSTYASHWQYGDCETCPRTGVSVAVFSIGTRNEPDHMQLCMLCLVKDIQVREDEMRRAWEWEDAQ